MPILSIIIPNYNYGRFADRLFGSFIAQKMPLDDTEIIFVDDGSDDDSLERAHKWSKTIPCLQFTILTPSRSGKPGLVRNHGLESATGKYLVSVDPDDTLHPNFLATCISSLEKNDNIDLVYTDYCENRKGESQRVELPDFKQVLLRTQNPLLSSAIYRRTLWDHGVRYRANTEYEDWDYWIQCITARARFMHIPQCLYSYEIHDSNFSYQAVKNDGTAKAQIVLNNPSFFHPLVLEWATDLMRGRLHAQAFQRGYIPGPEDVRSLLKMVEETVLTSQLN